jgi:hypothetical protein
MEMYPFYLTKEQKGLLVALAHETGKPIPALIAEACAGAGVQRGLGCLPSLYDGRSVDRISGLLERH